MRVTLYSSVLLFTTIAEISLNHYKLQLEEWNVFSFLENIATCDMSLATYNGFFSNIARQVARKIASCNTSLLLVPRKLLPRVFLSFFLFSDWLKSNHLRSRIERGFLDIFSRHICSAVTETIRMTNYATSFGAKKCSENQVRTAEIIRGTNNLKDIRNIILRISFGACFFKTSFRV